MVNPNTASSGAANQENPTSLTDNDTELFATVARYRASNAEEVLFQNGDETDASRVAFVEARGALIAIRPATVAGVIAKHEIFAHEEDGADAGVYLGMILSELRAIQARYDIAFEHGRTLYEYDPDVKAIVDAARKPEGAITQDVPTRVSRGDTVTNSYEHEAVGEMKMSAQMLDADFEALKTQLDKKVRNIEAVIAISLGVDSSGIPDTREDAEKAIDEWAEAIMDDPSLESSKSLTPLQNLLQEHHELSQQVLDELDARNPGIPGDK